MIARCTRWGIHGIQGISLVGLVCLSAVLLGCEPEGSTAPSAPAASVSLPDDLSMAEQVYQRLDEVRRQKQRQLAGYLDRLRTLGAAIQQDELMLEYFRVRSRLAGLAGSEAIPPVVADALRDLEQHVLARFAQNYRVFHDILFVSSDGTVFHTVRRRDYRGRNLLSDECDAHLATHLRESRTESFVDFRISHVTGEAAAYFIEPVCIAGEALGWLVLECSVNRINDIFVREPDLGRTGEVFLVNQDCQMLTESRFRADASILSQHLSPENIRGKFAEGSGHKVVTDYRGRRAMTSFETCSVLGSRWLLIAKIDQAEALSAHYRQNRGDLLAPLLASLRTQSVDACSPVDCDSAAIVVDMDDFRRASAGGQLVTYGVSTCTAVVAGRPGQFAYLGHASPYDSLYGQGDLDVVRNMAYRMRRYELRPYEVRDVQVVLVATHLETVGTAIEKLLEQRILLDQIRLLYNPSARSASVWHDAASGQTIVAWQPADGSKPLVYQDAASCRTIGEFLGPLVMPG